MFRSQKLVFISFILFVFFLSFPGIYSQEIELPEYVKKQLHSDKELQIMVITGRNLHDVGKLKDDPKCARIVVIQALPEEMKQETYDALLDWAKEGGTLWFYDSRMARNFGMEPSPISKEEIVCREIEGEYGAIKKYPGIATLAHPFGEHPVLSGVTGVLVFVMKVGDNQYSAVKATGGVKALLKPDLTKDAAVAAEKETGEGRIILKPLLWQKQVDGARFQANIKEYSAGFPVPHITSEQSKISDKMLLENKEAAKLTIVDIVQLSDGRSIWGKVLSESVIFETSEKTLTIPIKELATIEMNLPSGLDLVQYKQNREIRGFLSFKGGLQFMTPSGTKVLLEKRDMKKIFFDKEKNKETDNSGRIDTKENSRRTR